MRELAIVGGGPVGLAAALAAARRGFEPVVLEARPENHASDPRVFALSYATRLILERLGVWPYLKAAQPIRKVHVSERGAFGSVELQAAEIDLPALGFVVVQADLLQALRRCVDEAAIECITGAEVLEVVQSHEQVVVRYGRNGACHDLEAAMVALAEGGALLTKRADAREHAYHQQALIATVKAERAAADCAYERFTPEGPIALLPLGAMHALIWTVRTAEAEPLLALSDAQFEQALSERYGSRIGTLRLQGPRTSFPLKLRYAGSVASDRIVLIGNSAQTLHPVAGQGFNLGVRDAFELAQALAFCVGHGQALPTAVQRYRSRRQLDRVGGTLFTDVLVRAFSNENPFVSLARRAALVGLDAVAPAKKFLLRRLIFGAPH